MDLGLNGAKAVISGGTQGIGLAVAKQLMVEGVAVSIAARRQEGVDAALEELSALGTVVGQVCDVADYDATVAWMQNAADALGGIDIVVHNATASGQPGPGPQSWINNFSVDVLGMVGMSEGALPFLEQSERAALVQIASITGNWPSSGDPKAFARTPSRRGRSSSRTAFGTASRTTRQPCMSATVTTIPPNAWARGKRSHALSPFSPAPPRVG